MIKHDSIRGWFAYELYQQMQKNKDVWLIVGDLGYKVFDQHFKDFPERTINTGAAEVAMMNIAVGLAMSGKIPVVYSITTFLLYRPFEVIRNYINKEKWNVKLIGSGRDKNYIHDGFSHWSEDAKRLFEKNIHLEFCSYPHGGIFNNINSLWPETKEEIPAVVDIILKSKEPYFVSLIK